MNLAFRSDFIRDVENKKRLPMTHDSFDLSSNEVRLNIMSSPKNATLNFIRQFARTCVSVQGGSLGSMILN